MNARTVFNRIFYSFPVQLFVLLLKKNHFLLIFWLIVFGFITGSLSKRWGIPYLFLDPEYMGRVSIWSFFIMGMAFAGFYISFQISSYILNGFRFPFLATLSKPFFKYILNNSFFPFVVTGIYIYNFIVFQLFMEFQTTTAVILFTGAFLTGWLLVFFVTISYFFKTNTDVHKIFRVKMGGRPGVQQDDNPAGDSPVVKKKKGKEWRVETYLSNPFRVRLTRGTEHYSRSIIQRVFRQNHRNAAIVEVVVFVIILILGLFTSMPVFQIPAGASILLLFSMFIMLFSAFRFWVRGWATTVFLVSFLVVNQLSVLEFFTRRNPAFGLNYDGPKARYDLDALKKLNSRENYDADYRQTIAILEKWKRDVTGGSGEKPPIIVICTSGGGLRSAVWTFRTLQVADSMVNGKLMAHSRLISGSSGGIVGASYFRELYLRYKENKLPGYRDNRYLVNIGKDLLNPIALQLTVSDMFVNFGRFTDGKYTYKIDRGYAFETQLNQNTGHVLNKRLGDYIKPELDAIIPMMIVNPTIVQDGRRIFFSATPVTYISNKLPEDQVSFIPLTEGVEYRRMFAMQDGDNIRFTSVLRVNSTFPYITPTVTLPSEPGIELMDSGVRDNFGIQTGLKFLYIFRDWISRNCSRVVLLQIRDTYKEAPVEKKPGRSILDNISSPLGSFYGNFAKVHDYNHDELIQYASSWFNGRMDHIMFELPDQKEKVSLSWHLTTREKNLIYNAIELPENQQALSQLKGVLMEKW